MESKHTPGPWAAGKLGRVMAEVGKSGHRGEGWMLAESMGDDDMIRSGERDANTKLIAAAPDLLAACIKAEKIIGDMADTGVNPTRRKVWEALTAAIKAATP